MKITLLLFGLAALAAAQEPARIVVSPQRANLGSKIAATADVVGMTITADTRPAGAIQIELYVDPPHDPPTGGHTPGCYVHDRVRIAYYTLSFVEGQHYTFTHSCEANVVTGSFRVAGPGIEFDITAKTATGQLEHSIGTL